MREMRESRISFP